MNKKALGNIIRYYRFKNNLKQKEFAKLVKCTPSTLYKIEWGKQEAKSELVLNILSIILPTFKSELLLTEIEAEFNETQKSRRTKTFGENTSNHKLTNETVKQIKELLKQGVNQKFIASKYNINASTISRIKLNQIWKHI